VDHDEPISKAEFKIWLNGICDDTIPATLFGDAFVAWVASETGMTGVIDGEHLAKHLYTKYGLTLKEFNAANASCFADITEYEELSEGGGLKEVTWAISGVHEVVDNL